MRGGQRQGVALRLLKVLGQLRLMAVLAGLALLQVADRPVPLTGKP
ncbi:hypothetical protein [Deinococcus sp. PESE-13]